MNTPIIDWGYLFIYCCRLINARVPTSPVAYLRILELDWKEHCLKLLWPQRFESSKLCPSSFKLFFFGTNGKKNPLQNKENKVEQTKTGSTPHLALPLEGHRKKKCPSFWRVGLKLRTFELWPSQAGITIDLYSWKLDTFTVLPILTLFWETNPLHEELLNCYCQLYTGIWYYVTPLDSHWNVNR